MTQPDAHIEQISEAPPPRADDWLAEKPPRRVTARELLLLLLGRSGIAIMAFSAIFAAIVAGIGILWSLAPLDDFADLPTAQVLDEPANPETPASAEPGPVQLLDEDVNALVKPGSELLTVQ
jgi:hypothetical protein